MEAATTMDSTGNEGNTKVFTRRKTAILLAILAVFSFYYFDKSWGCAPAQKGDPPAANGQS